MHASKRKQTKAAAQAAASKARPHNPSRLDHKTNQTTYKLLCWVKHACSWRDKHWPAHLMSPAVHHPVLLRDWVVIRTRPSAPCLLVPGPTSGLAAFLVCCAASPHPIFSPWSRHACIPTHEQPVQPCDLTGLDRAGKAGEGGGQANRIGTGLDWVGIDWTWNLNSMTLS